MDIKFDQQEYDIVLFEDGDGNLDLKLTEDDAEDLMQRLVLRFKTYPRDLFWNVNYGIDYLNSVFGKNRPKTTVDIIVKNEILKEPMVEKLESFESDIINYSYSCKFSVKLRYEEVVSNFYLLTDENGLILTNESGESFISAI
jgi:hypothetical protein